MTFKIVIFWTDALIYLLIATVIFYIFWARRQEHLRAPWRQLLRSRLGMGSLAILFTFVIIGLLDSVHFQMALPSVAGISTTQYSTEATSILDYVLQPLGQEYEATYSAPFATNLYVKKTMVNAAGNAEWVYPPLQYVKVSTSLLQQIISPAILAILIWVVVSAIFIYFFSRRRQLTWRAAAHAIFSGKTSSAWGVFLLTWLAIFLLVLICYHLSRYYHILGTDKIGQDVFYETLKSIRTGLVIGTLTTLVMLPFAVLLGTMAGYFGSWIDDIIQYVYTTLNSIPAVLLIAAAILSLQILITKYADFFSTIEARADMRLLALCIILGITSWTNLCRLLRGEALKLREVDYIAAAKTLGVSDMKIIVRHILPNVTHIIVITVVLDFSALVLAEAVLSYVGVGVDPTTNSWGNMINAARLELAREPVVWWPLLASFIFMFMLVLSANLFSDAVRDAFDPRLRK